MEKADKEEQEAELLPGAGAGRDGIFEDIEQAGGALTGNPEESFDCLTVIGQIEGH